MSLISFLNFLFKNTIYEIYTDGSFKDGIGSWAYVVTKKDKIIKEQAEKSDELNSNRLEFIAVIKSLQGMTRGSKIIVYSD